MDEDNFILWIIVSALLVFPAAWVVMLTGGFIHSEILPSMLAFGYWTAVKAVAVIVSVIFMITAVMR